MVLYNISTAGTDVYTSPSLQASLPNITFPAGTVTPASLNIPYVSMRACLTSSVQPPSITNPVPFNTILYFNADVCPSGWQDASFQASDRLVVTASPTIAVAQRFGDASSGSFDGSHQHEIDIPDGTYWSSYVEAWYCITRSYALSVLSVLGLIGTFNGGGHSPNYAIDPRDVTTGSVDIIPYRLLRACEPQPNAATVTADMGLVAYFNESCPVGWTDLSNNATFAGRLIKGAASPSAVETFGDPLLTPNIPQHVHKGWQSVFSYNNWGLLNPPGNFSTGGGSASQCASPTICPTPPPGYFVGSISLNVLDVHSDVILDQTQSFMDPGTPADVSFSVLRLCRYDSTTTTFDLPPGTVAFMTTTSCPVTNGWLGDFTDAAGRLFRTTSILTSISHGIQTNAVSPVTSLDDIGKHNHTLLSTSAAL